jgi:hypothetical protein
MDPIKRFSAIARRTLLATLATLPVLSSAL